MPAANFERNVSHEVRPGTTKHYCGSPARKSPLGAHRKKCAQCQRVKAREAGKTS